MYILQTLYNSLIVSYINYGLLLWGVESHRVESLQKKAVRLITNSNYSAHTTTLFNELGLLKVQDMFKLKLLKFYYKLSYVSNPYFFSQSLRNIILAQPPPPPPTRPSPPPPHTHTLHPLHFTCTLS